MSQIIQSIHGQLDCAQKAQKLHQGQKLKQKQSGIQIHIVRLIRIPMSAELLPKCSGFIQLSMTAISPSIATRSSAVTKRLRDASCLSVVSFNSTKSRAQSIVVSYSGLSLRAVKCCSVVFGVMLRLLVINTSSSSPVNNKRRRLPAMSVTNL